MTEDEAKTKWCPMVQTGLTAGMAVNHHVGSYLNAPQAGDVHDETRCIGKGCMMFRNAYEYPHEGRKYGWFCGLAGDGHD